MSSYAKVALFTGYESGVGYKKGKWKCHVSFAAIKCVEYGRYYILDLKIDLKMSQMKQNISIVLNENEKLS